MQDKPVVWVTGGAGYIGSHVCAQLKAKHTFPIVIDNFSTGRKDVIKDMKVFEWDVSSSQTHAGTAFSSLIQDFGKPKAIIHLAAKTSVLEGECQKPEYYETNVIGTYNMAKLAEKIGCKNFVFASSAAVYGDLGNKFADAKLKRLKPLNHYGETKLKAEELLQELFPGLRSTVLRYFNVAGAYRHLGRTDKECRAIIPAMAKAVLKNEPLSLKFRKGLFGYKSPIRDFIHVTDVAYMTVWRALYPDHTAGVHVENAGRGQPVSIYDLKPAIEAACQNKLIVDFANISTHEIMWSVAKLEKPWSAKKFTTLQRIISSELEWQKSLLSRG